MSTTNQRILIVIVIGGLALLLAVLLGSGAAAEPAPDSNAEPAVLAAGPGPQAGAGCCSGGKGEAQKSGKVGPGHGKAASGCCDGGGKQKQAAGGGCGKGGGCMGLGAVQNAPVNAALTDAEKAAMDALYIDEHRGRAVYFAIMEKFGEIRPYVNIARSEGCHINALTNLYNRYGVETPEVALETPPDFDSVKASLEWSAKFERENAALYDEYLAATDKPDLTQVFTALGNASRYHHLPAFERALSRR